MYQLAKGVVKRFRRKARPKPVEAVQLGFGETVVIGEHERGSMGN